jgi:hypothetical protein
MVMNYQFLWKMGKFLISRATVRFSRRTILHGESDVDNLSIIYMRWESGNKNEHLGSAYAISCNITSKH